MAKLNEVFVVKEENRKSIDLEDKEIAALLDAIKVAIDVHDEFDSKVPNFPRRELIVIKDKLKVLTGGPSGGRDLTNIHGQKIPVDSKGWPKGTEKWSK